MESLFWGHEKHLWGRLVLTGVVLYLTVMATACAPGFSPRKIPNSERNSVVITPGGQAVIGGSGSSNGLVVGEMSVANADTNAWTANGAQGYSYFNMKLQLKYGGQSWPVEITLSPNDPEVVGLWEYYVERIGIRVDSSCVDSNCQNIAVLIDSTFLDARPGAQTQRVAILFGRDSPREGFTPKAMLPLQILNGVNVENSLQAIRPLQEAYWGTVNGGGSRRE